MEQATKAALVFSRRTATDDSRNLGGIAVLGQIRPFAIFQTGDNAPGNFFLCVPGIHAPDSLGTFDRHLVVDNVDPYRLTGSPFNHDAVPSGKLQLGSKASTEVAVAKPFNRMQHWSETLHLASPGTRHKSAGERGCHHDDKVPGIECLKRQLVANQVKENSGANAMATAELFILRSIDGADRLCGQVDSQYFTRVSACHCCSPPPSFHTGLFFGMTVLLSTKPRFSQ